MRDLGFKEIRIRMIRRGMSSREVAERMGISIQTFCYLLGGRTNWTLERMWDLMDALELPAEDLYKCFPKEEVKK